MPRRWFENEIIRSDLRPIQHKHTESQLFWSHVHLSVTIVILIISLYDHLLFITSHQWRCLSFWKHFLGISVLIVLSSPCKWRSRSNLTTLRGIPGIAASRNSAQLPGVQAGWEKKFNTTEKKQTHAVMLA